MVLGTVKTAFASLNRVEPYGWRSKYNRGVTRRLEALARVELFPLFLKLRGRRCLVVGAGKISEGKIAGLLAAGAKVRVVAPNATAQIVAWHKRGKIRWEQRRFAVRDLDGAFLVVAATSSTKVHRTIYTAARKRGVLCNVVDVPPLCDFYYPSVVRRGALQIAISTAGASPSLAKRLREQLEGEFGAEYSVWLKHLAAERKKILARKMSADEKLKLLHEQASAKAFGIYLKKGRGAKARRTGRKSRM